MTIYIDGVKAGPVYGEISLDDNEDGQTLATSGDWYKITQFDTNHEALQTTPDHANDKITVLLAGIYAVEFVLSFNGSPNVTYHIVIYIGGVADTTLKVQRRIGAGNDVGAAAISGLASIGAGQTVEAYIQADGDNKDFVMGHGNLTVHSVDK